MNFSLLAQDRMAWVHALGAVKIPVLSRTIEELARLRQNEERVLARDISRVLLHDPMFTLRVLRFLPTQRKPGRITEITTVEHALMMLGVAPFFAHFSDLPAVESVLAGNAPALRGLMRVVSRAHHAAMFARDWAWARHDIESDEVVAAALLHDLAEILLWCFAPELALRIDAMLRADGSLRSGVAQRAVLGFTFIDLQLALIAEWKLPALLQTLMDDKHARSPRAVNVLLAVDLARHSARGGNDPALPDDYAAIAKFLRLPEDEVMERIERTALQAESARDWYQAGAAPSPEQSGN
jgi:HD-like signal output (HDOD) protein